MPRKQAAITEFLLQHPERVTTSQTRVKTDDLVQLILLFPDIDRDYARLALQNYTDNAVACVTEKLVDRNHGAYPRHVNPDCLWADVRISKTRMWIRMLYLRS